MKQLLITIAAVVLVGCGPPDISIHKAALDGNIEAIWQHLDAGANVNVGDSYSNTPPLWYAVLNGHKEIVEVFIAEGADVNWKTEFGSTPLHGAAQFGHKEVAELLIAKGADVNAKDADGMTPLDFAIIYSQPETADLLRKHGGKVEGADVNAKGMHGFTPLHLAAKEHPLHLAAKEGLKETLELLIAKGSDVNAKDEGGETPLDYAIIGKDTETADLLRKHGGKTGEELKAEGK